MPDDAETPGAGTCVVKLLDQGNGSRWDAFVSGSPQASFFHRAAWRDILEGVLGHRCYYLYAEARGAIAGVLPLAEVRSRLFGHALISTPFCVYGGVAARDAGVEARLVEAAAKLAGELQVDYLELRNREAMAGGWPVKDLYVSFRKVLDPDEEANFQAIPRKQRAMVRKGIEAGLTAEPDESVDTFFRVYAESVRNLGTPVLSRRYYARVKAAFGKDCEITVVRDHGEPVAAAMSFYFRDEVHPYYGGSIARGRGLKANDFMYWAVMRRAIERGARLFDYGRSKRDTGSYHFKKHWGFEPEPLPYAYHLVRARTIPNVSPTNPKYRLFIKAWQHLPLAVSCAIGPWLARNLG